jgi:protein translocase SecG subunit
VLIFRDILLAIQAVVSIVLIVIVTSQTTKNEGLTGSIGGQMTPSFKGKPGMEEQVRTWTIYVSAAWFLLCFLIALVWSRTG